MNIALIRSVMIALIMIFFHPSQCQTAKATQEPEAGMKIFNVYFGGLIGPIYSANINAEIKLATRKSGVKTYFLRLGGGSDNALITDGGPGYLGALTMLKRKRKDRYFEISAGWFSGKSSLYATSINYPILDIGRRIHYPSGIILRYHVGVLGVGGSIGYGF